MRTHHYQITLRWTGNTGTGTSDYRAYERTHLIAGAGKTLEIPGSSDPAFRGDATRYNPEEMLLAALASCHMLWFLHLCAANGVIVEEYTDAPEGGMAEDARGSGRFTEVTLRPRVVVGTPEMRERVDALHASAGRYCFIANSVNFPVRHAGVTVVIGEQE